MRVIFIIIISHLTNYFMRNLHNWDNLLHTHTHRAGQQAKVSNYFQLYNPVYECKFIRIRDFYF